MTQITIFEHAFTHLTILELQYLYDPNYLNKTIIIDGTVYAVVGWRDSFESNSLTRYVIITDSEDVIGKF